MIPQNTVRKSNAGFHISVSAVQPFLPTLHGKINYFYRIIKNMRPATAWFMCFVMIIASCRKEHATMPDTPPDPAKKILLKDITIPRLPTPYYHFEYRTDSTVAKVSFASDFTMYDVFYDGNNIREMRNNILVNHDTLRYFYDNIGKLAVIKFINDAG